MWTTIIHKAGAGIPARLRCHSRIERVTSEQNKTFDLSASFKAYDVRGIVGESITAEIVEAVGAAFIDVLGLEGETVLVGGDMRPSSPEFRYCSARAWISFRPDSEEMGWAPAFAILMPLYSAGLWLAVKVAPAALRDPQAK